MVPELSYRWAESTPFKARIGYRHMRALYTGPAWLLLCRLLGAW